MLVTTALVVFTVSPSTELVSVPSNDRTLTNIVRTIPNIHITLDLNILAILSICLLSDIFEIIPSAVPY